MFGFAYLQAAWQWIFDDVIPQRQKQRYQQQNITVTFLDDVNATTGPDWLYDDFLFDFNGTFYSNLLIYP